MKFFHIFLLLLVVAIWGMNFVSVKIALDAMPPLLVCFVRFFLTSMPAVFFFKRPAVPFGWIVVYGLLMFVLQFALIFSGMKAGLSPGLSSILLQTQVFFSILFGSMILKEQVTRWQIIGALISFSGILVVCMNLGASATPLGLFLVLSAAATWGMGSVIVKKMGKIQSGSLLTWGSLIAWPPLLLLSLLFEHSHPILLHFHHFPWEVHGALLFITFCSTVFGFGVWNWLVQIYPLGTIAPFTLLVPVFGMAGSALMLGETLHPWKFLAGILVVSGLCFILLGPRLFAKKIIETSDDSSR
ncbi:MAG: EamA family transporter [Chlamydiales bacterium]